MDEDDFLIELFNSNQNKITKFPIQNQKNINIKNNIPLSSNNVSSNSNVSPSQTSSFYDHIFINEDGEVTDYFLELIKKDQPDLLLNHTSGFNENNESNNNKASVSYQNLNQKSNINSTTNNTNSNNTITDSNTNNLNSNVVQELQYIHPSDKTTKQNEYNAKYDDQIDMQQTIVKTKKKKEIVINKKNKKNVKNQELSPNFMMAKSQSGTITSNINNNTNSINCNEIEFDNKIKSFELRIKGHLQTIKSLALQVQDSQSIVIKKNKEIHDLEMKLKTGITENMDSVNSNCHSPHINSTQGTHTHDEQLKMLQLTVHKAEELNLQYKEQIKFLQHKCSEETSRRQRAEERSRVLKNFSDKSKERCISLQTHNDELKQALQDFTNRIDKNKKTIKDLQSENNLYKISIEELQQDVKTSKQLNEKSNNIIKQLQISLENSRNELYQQNKENTNINSKNKQLLLENSMIQEKYNLNKTKKDRFLHIKDFNSVSYQDRNDKHVEVLSPSYKNLPIKSFEDHNDFIFYKNNHRPPLDITNRFNNNNNNNNKTNNNNVASIVNKEITHNANNSDTEMIIERRKSEHSLPISKDDIYINTKTNNNNNYNVNNNNTSNDNNNIVHNNNIINTIDNNKVVCNYNTNNANIKPTNKTTTNNNDIIISANDINNNINTVDNSNLATAKSKITLSFIKQKAMENGCNPEILSNNCHQLDTINIEEAQIENPRNNLLTSSNSSIRNSITTNKTNISTSDVETITDLKAEVNEIPKDISRLKSLYDKVIHKSK